MPVKDETIYPGGSLRSKEWLEMRDQILDEQGYLCKLCHAPHGQEIVRSTVTGKWMTTPDWFQQNEEPCRYVKIRLTVAHINQDPTDNRRVNLMGLCQRCHNLIDMPYRKLGRRTKTA